MTFEPFKFRKKEHKEAHLCKVKHSDEINAKLISWTTKPYNQKHTLIFSGNVGNGKTYFAAAYYNYLVERGENVRVYDETYLLDELRLCWEMTGESEGHRREVITDCDYLILDDLGSTGAYRDNYTGLHRLGMTDNDRKMIEAFINSRLEKELPLLITTNFSEKDLTAFFSPKIISRLFAHENTIVEINIPDRRKIPNF